MDENKHFQKQMRFKNNPSHQEHSTKTIEKTLKKKQFFHQNSRVSSRQFLEVENKDLINKGQLLSSYV